MSFIRICFHDVPILLSIEYHGSDVVSLMVVGLLNCFVSWLGKRQCTAFHICFSSNGVMFFLIKLKSRRFIVRQRRHLFYSWINFNKKHISISLREPYAIKLIILVERFLMKKIHLFSNLYVDSNYMKFDGYRSASWQLQCAMIKSFILYLIIKSP